MFLAAALLLFAEYGAGCKAACPMLRVAADGCPAVVEFVGDDGRVQRVQLSRPELARLAKDGGAP